MSKLRLLSLCTNSGMIDDIWSSILLGIRATRNETASIGLVPALRDYVEGAFSAAQLSSAHHFRRGGLRAFVRLNTTSDAIPTLYRRCTDAFVYGGLSGWVDFASKERPQSFNETLHFIASTIYRKVLPFPTESFAAAI